MVDTKTVARRDITYATLDELIADAEKAAATNAPTTGNWSKGQIFEHVARVMDMNIDGFPFKVNWFFRLVSSKILLKRFLKNGMPSGFKPSKSVATKLMPDDTDEQTALQHLRTAVERMKSLDHNIDHAFFGNLNPDEARAINCRHAELHMSFIVDAE